jgi:transcriptional regulator with XRE-family HTH domain
MGPVAKLLGARIKELRLEQHKRAIEVAVGINVDPSHYYAIERGTAQPSLDAIIGLARMLKVDEADLFIWPGTGARADLHDIVRRVPNASLAELKQQLEKHVPAKAPAKTKPPRR